MSRAQEEVKRRVKLFAFLIKALDGFRVGFYTDISRIREALVELGLPNKPVDWNEVLAAIEDIAKIPSRDPSYERLIRLERAATWLFGVSLIVLVSSLVLMFGLSNIYLSFIATMIAFALTNVGYFLKIYVSYRTSQIYSRNYSLLEKRGAVLKRAIELLLSRLRGELRKLGISPSEYRINLYNSDYRGIYVIKKPSFIRSRYVVSLAKR